MPEVIQYKDFIGLYDNALSKEECANIIYSFNEHEKANPEHVQKGIDHFKDELFRKDYAIFANQHMHEVHDLIANRLHECLLLYCEKYFTLKGVKAASYEVKLQRTPPQGGYHVWHCEQDSMSAGPRILVWTIYLNDVPQDQGETEFLWQGLRVHPKAGRCAIWPAAFTHIHRGNPVYTHDKYIATGWYLLTE